MLLLDPASVWRVATAWHPVTRLAFRFFATYFGRDSLVLVSRGFHWVQEYPFNR